MLGGLICHGELAPPGGSGVVTFREKPKCARQRGYSFVAAENNSLVHWLEEIRTGAIEPRRRRDTEFSSRHRSIFPADALRASAVQRPNLPSKVRLLPPAA